MQFRVAHAAPTRKLYKVSIRYINAQYLIDSLLCSKEMVEISTSSITTKGQITIPKEIRDRLNLKEGDRVIFLVEEEHATMKKASERKLSEILRKQKPWKEHSIKFQKRMRKEW
jgi:antitoxin PrlF